MSDQRDLWEQTFRSALMEVGRPDLAATECFRFDQEPPIVGIVGFAYNLPRDRASIDLLGRASRLADSAAPSARSRFITPPTTRETQ